MATRGYEDYKYHARPAWFDRNPKIEAEQYGPVEKTPHNYTTRFSYTVPVGRIALVELLESSVERTVAATTAGYAIAKFLITPEGYGASKDMINAYIITNTIGDKNYRSVGSTITLFSGDKIEMVTADLSTGGKCIFYLALKLTEFDA